MGGDTGDCIALCRQVAGVDSVMFQVVTMALCLMFCVVVNSVGTKKREVIVATRGFCVASQLGQVTRAFFRRDRSETLVK